VLVPREEVDHPAGEGDVSGLVQVDLIGGAQIEPVCDIDAVGGVAPGRENGVGRYVEDVIGVIVGDEGAADIDGAPGRVVELDPVGGVTVGLDLVDLEADDRGRGRCGQADGEQAARQRSDGQGGEADPAQALGACVCCIGFSFVIDAESDGGVAVHRNSSAVQRDGPPGCLPSRDTAHEALPE
jgi:hypothetical protein